MVVDTDIDINMSKLESMAEPYGPEGSMYQPRPLTLIICLMSNLKVNVAHRGSQGPRNSRERNPRLNCAKGNGF